MLYVFHRHIACRSIISKRVGCSLKYFHSVLIYVGISHIVLNMGCSRTLDVHVISFCYEMINTYYVLHATNKDVISLDWWKKNFVFCVGVNISKTQKLFIQSTSNLIPNKQTHSFLKKIIKWVICL